MKQANLSKKFKKKAEKQNVAPRKKIKDLEETQIAILNLLEDLEKERESLQISNAKSEAILANISEGLILIDKDRRIILINKFAEASTGWSAPDALNKLWPEIVVLETKDGKKVPLNKNPLYLACRASKAAPATYFFIRKNKTKFPATITTSPVKTGNKILGAVLAFQDITNEWETEKDKTEFISIVSHQLGTPLVGIQWTIERILKKENLTIGLQGYLQDVHISVRRLSSLVKNLLNASRFEEGVFAISPEKIELIAFIKSYISECTPLIIKKSITLDFEKHPKILNVINDRNILRNIVQSLVSNAIEYTPERGKIEISVEKKDGHFLLTISDTGIGIPKKAQAGIFEKFSRADNAKLIKPSGSGLGLYLGQQATKILGGKIWFKSKENKGTTFFIKLPLKVKPRKGKKNLA